MESGVGVERARRSDPDPIDPGEARIEIRGEPDVIVARGRARDLAARLGFGAADLTSIAAAIAELSANIVRYARAGEVLLRPVERDGRRGLRVTARDRGPGILNIARAMGGGFSTSGGLGLGLAGARRLMDEFAIASRPGHGTVVVATKWVR